MDKNAGMTAEGTSGKMDGETGFIDDIGTTLGNFWNGLQSKLLRRSEGGKNSLLPDYEDHEFDHRHHGEHNEHLYEEYATDTYYKMTDETVEVDGHVLRRIEATRDIKLSDGTIVRAGEKGGYIEKEANLFPSGNAWVGGDAKVYGSAQVSDGGIAAGEAILCDAAEVRHGAEVSGHAVMRGMSKAWGDARVSGHAVLSDSASVMGGIVAGNVTMEDHASVYGNATVTGNVHMTGCSRAAGNAEVSGDVILTDNTRVRDDAVLSGSVIMMGKSKLCGSARYEVSEPDVGVLSGDQRITDDYAVSGTIEGEADPEYDPGRFSWLLGAIRKGGLRKEFEALCKTIDDASRYPVAEVREGTPAAGAPDRHVPGGLSGGERKDYGVSGAPAPAAAQPQPAGQAPSASGPDIGDGESFLAAVLLAVVDALGDASDAQSSVLGAVADALNGAGNGAPKAGSSGLRAVADAFSEAADKEMDRLQDEALNILLRDPDDIGTGSDWKDFNGSGGDAPKAQSHRSGRRAGIEGAAQPAEPAPDDGPGLG